LLGGAIWKMCDNVQMTNANQKAKEYYGRLSKEREDREQCDLELQKEIYLRLKVTHTYPDGLYCREPVKHDKEAMRVTKKYLELTGKKYYDHGFWNLDYCEFDNKGYLRRLNNEKVYQFDDFI